MTANMLTVKHDSATGCPTLALVALSSRSTSTVLVVEHYFSLSLERILLSEAQGSMVPFVAIATSKRWKAPPKFCNTLLRYRR